MELMNRNAGCCAAHGVGEPHPAAADEGVWLTSAFKALAHPARRAILEYLTEIDKCVCGQIVDMLPLAQSTVSQHLKILRDAGFIQGEVAGPTMCYCVNKITMERFKRAVAGL